MRGPNAVRSIWRAIAVIATFIALYLFAGSHPDLKGDQAYGLLVKTVLPPWMTGFFLAAMAGAVLSSFCGALNSTSTLFSLGIYRGLTNTTASEIQVVKAGKTFSAVVALVSMLVAPLLAGQDSIFGYLQKMNALYFIPILSVVVMGLLLKRMPAIAAKVGLIAGVAAIALPVVVFFQNLHRVPLNVLFAQLSMPASLMYLSHLVLGFIAGWLVHSLRRRGGASLAKPAGPAG